MSRHIRTRAIFPKILFAQPSLRDSVWCVMNASWSPPHTAVMFSGRPFASFLCCRFFLPGEKPFSGPGASIRQRVSKKWAPLRLRRFPQTASGAKSRQSKCHHFLTPFYCTQHRCIRPKETLSREAHARDVVSDLNPLAVGWRPSLNEIHPQIAHPAWI